MRSDTSQDCSTNLYRISTKSANSKCELICISIHHHYANIRSWVHPDKQLVVLIFHSSATAPLQKR